MTIAPAYAITAVDKTRIVRKVRKEPNKPFEFYEEEVTGGYMVTFPGGHSILLDTQKDLAAIGLVGEPVLVDTSTGEVLPVTKHKRKE